jgi:ubiquinone biosynthesis protein UbiJ
MFLSLLSATIEQLLNRVIALDSQLARSLESTTRQQFSIEVTDLKLAFTMIFDGTKFIVLPGADKQSDCFVSADLNTLISLKKPENVTQLIRTGKLNLEGDLHIAQNYSKAFSQLDIDWAEHLSHYLGDGAAYTLINFLHNAKQRSEQQIGNSQSALTSLLQDELKVSIHPLEAQLFKQQCRHLQQEVTQLEQRISLLSQAI